MYFGNAMYLDITFMTYICIIMFHTRFSRLNNGNALRGSVSGTCKISQ